VGRPLPHARVRVDERGEIRVATPTLLGYLGESAGVDGEVATGDLGRFDADGFLYVTGRSRNVIITSLGRNVSPEWVESELQVDGTIGWAVVVGEGRPTLGAWLHPSRAGIRREQLEASVAAANRRLPPYARIAHWRSVPEAPTQLNGWLTANGRVRRDVVLAALGPPIPERAEG
ncbi:MAG: long-chain acyl-CoA synthetase, partial [Comamonadaceae bacterium]